MEPFRVHILGCGSATPSTRHWASSQVVEIRGKMMMVDCAEGTQVQLRRARVNFSRITSVFISHTHGDHCLGLIGMISSFGLLGRVAPLHVYAPREFSSLFAQMMAYFCPSPGYDVEFHGVDTTLHTILYEDHSCIVESLPLEHRVPCCGFLFREKPTLPHIRRDMIDFYGIPLSQINNIKAGMNWVLDDGRVVENARLVTPADPPRSYAYCSDTRYLPHLHQWIRGVNLLYHECTYAEDKRANAQKYFHSTASDAARVARDAEAGQLLLGHYSAGYENESVFLEEARPIFANTLLSNEGMAVEVK